MEEERRKNEKRGKENWEPEKKKKKTGAGEQGENIVKNNKAKGIRLSRPNT